MNVSHPYKLDEIDYKNIIYTETKSVDDKKIIYLKYKEKNKYNKLVFQTPYLFLKNNIIKSDKITEIDINLICKTDKKLEDFKKNINILENKILNDAKLNYNKWFQNYNFKNKLLYQKIFRKNKDNDEDILKLKIINNSNFKTILLSNNKNININDIPTNSWNRSILEVYAIWINNNGFGLFIRPILISFKKEQIEQYNFYEDSDNDKNNDLESDIFLKPDNIEHNNVVNIISTSSSNINNNNKSSTSD